MSGEGYDCIRKTGWLDSYLLAEKKDDGATVDHVIDGWRDKMTEGESCRLDYIFSRNPGPDPFQQSDLQRNAVSGGIRSFWCYDKTIREY